MSKEVNPSPMVVSVAQPVHCRQPQHRSHHLQNDLLHGFQTLVLFLGNLGKVVDKADNTEQQAEQQTAQHTQRLTVAERGDEVSHAEQAVQHIAHAGRHDAAHDEQDAAHGGGSLLVCVPAGTEVDLDGLPEFQLVQPWQQRLSAQCGNDKRQQSYENVNPERHDPFPPPAQKLRQYNLPGASLGSP